MKEYKIAVRENGTGVIAGDYWNPDKSLKAMQEKPYLFEVGMKVVDPWGTIVTISVVNKRPSIENRAPQWTLNVEENGNTYVYYEIIGIFIKELTKEEVKSLLKNDEVI